MVEKTKTKEHELDATGQSLGRLASEVAKLLMGKDTSEYQRHIAPDVSVRVINASKMAISQKKKKNKKYTRYTGYPGGLREETLGSVVERQGYAVALERAVRGMLPSNKLRSKMLQNLTIEE